MSEELSANHLILEELKAINAESRQIRKDLVEQTNDIRKDLVAQTKDLRRELTEELTIQTQDIRTTSGGTGTDEQGQGPQRSTLHGTRNSHLFTSR